MTALPSLQTGAYILATLAFIFGLKMLGKTSSARKGNLLSAAGMLIAIIFTLLHQGLDYRWIMGGILVGSFAGGIGARMVPMTRMPEAVALLNGFGGIASLLVGWNVYRESQPLSTFEGSTVFFALLIGGVTFSGSLVAWGKLGEFIYGKAILFRGQLALNGILLLIPFVSGALFVFHPEQPELFFYLILTSALVLGVMTVIPIGGADMPVIISLLNSYSGLAARSGGIRRQQPSADRGGFSGGRQRHYPDQHHVQSHEQVARQCIVQRIRRRRR
jgi:H+-translocating NAD(P) transhydrogenase subunit beta